MSKTYFHVSMNNAINVNQQGGIDSLSRYLPGNALNSSHTMPATSYSVLQQSTNTLAIMPPSMSTRSSVANTLPSLAPNQLSQPSPALPRQPSFSALPMQPSVPTLYMQPQPEMPVSSVGTAETQTVQSNLGSLSSGAAMPTACQVFSGNLSDAQLAADQKLQIGLMSLKVPLPTFCPLSHNPREWVDSLDLYCKNLAKTYNPPLEKLMIDNLYSLFPKEEKRWLMSKIYSGRPFSWEILKDQLLDHFSRICNTKFKQIYMREWDEPQIYVEFAREKLESLKIIFPGEPLKKLFDIIRSGLPDDVNIEIGKNHMVYDSEDYFFDVLTHQDLEKERANLELMNEIANEVNREGGNEGTRNEETVASLATPNTLGPVTSTLTTTTATYTPLSANTILSVQTTNSRTSGILPNTTTTVTTSSSPLFSV